MINKTILMLAITAAFIAETITTGTIAFADNDDKNGNLFKKIVNQLRKIVAAIEGIEPTVNVEVAPTEVQVVGVIGPQGPPGQDADTTGLQNQIYAHEAKVSVLQGNGMPPPDGTPCDDRDPNTVNDVYTNDICAGTRFQK